MKIQNVSLVILFLAVVSTTDSFAKASANASYAIARFGVAADECPSDFPLNCNNGRCCPSGATLYCGAMEPTPCFDPNTLSDEQLKLMGEKCNPLLSCY